MKYFFLLLLLFSSSCKTLESLINPIYIAVGVETINLDFVSSGGNSPTRDLLQRLQGAVFSPFTENYKETHATVQSERAFLTLSSPPTRFSKTHWFFRYLGYSINIDSPRFFRGMLKDYPDRGFNSSDPNAVVLSTLLPQNQFITRRVDFLYQEIRSYAGLYLGYWDNPNFYIALGLRYGNAQYSLQLSENDRIISDVRNRNRPLAVGSINFGYDIGKYFPDTILSNTHIFVEAITDLGNRYPLKVETLRSNFESPNSLFVDARFLRIGLLKEIDLLPTKNGEESP